MLKSVREKCQSHMKKNHKNNRVFLNKTLKAKRVNNDVFQVLVKITTNLDCYIHQSYPS